jgi:hypothetical protein
LRPGFDASLNAKRITANMRFAMLLFSFPDRSTQCLHCAQGAGVRGIGAPRARGHAAACATAPGASVAIVIHCGDA